MDDVVDCYELPHLIIISGGLLLPLLLEEILNP